jgi:hypothetical protein
MTNRRPDDYDIDMTGKKSRLSNALLFQMTEWTIRRGDRDCDYDDDYRHPPLF